MGNPLIESLFKKITLMRNLRSCLLVLATICRTQAETTTAASATIDGDIAKVAANAPTELAVPTGQCFNSKSPITL